MWTYQFLLAVVVLWSVLEWHVFKAQAVLLRRLQLLWLALAALCLAMWRVSWRVICALVARVSLLIVQQGHLERIFLGLFKC